MSARSSGFAVHPSLNSSIRSFASPFKMPKIGLPVLMYDWNLAGSVMQYLSVSEIMSTSALANQFGISWRGCRPQNFTASSPANLSFSGSHITPPPTSHNSASGKAAFSKPAITFSRFCGTPILPANMNTTLPPGPFCGRSISAGSHCGIHSASRPVNSLMRPT